MVEKYTNDNVMLWYKLHEQGYSIKNISKTFHVSESRIYTRFKKANLKTINLRKNIIQEDFFSKNNPQSFYWAGFIAADGCIYVKDNKYKQLRIELSSKDYEHLLKFKKAICFTGDIYLTKRKSSLMVINSKNIFNDLSRFGIVQNKTLIYEIPMDILSNKHINHFLRGYFDGDGCLSRSLSKNEYISQMNFNVVGTKKFINQFSYILEKECNIGVKQARNVKNIFSLSFGGNNIVKNITDFLYKQSNDNIRLNRKYNIYLLNKNTNKDYIYKSKFSAVIGVNIKTGEIIRFDAFKFAEKAGFTRQAISACCRGLSKTHKGHTWVYADRTCNAKKI